MEFDIIRDTRQMGETITHIHQVDTFSGTPREAIEYARMYAIDHANNIIAPVGMADFGGYLLTSNGTRVRYYATERD